MAGRGPATHVVPAAPEVVGIRARPGRDQNRTAGPSAAAPSRTTAVSSWPGSTRPSTHHPLPQHPSSPPTTQLLGLDFAQLHLGAAVRWALDRPAGARFGYVVTPNADHLVRLRHDPSLRAIYRDATLRLLDSRVVSGAACAIGLTPPPVVPGSDLLAALLHCLPPGERLTIIGLRAAFLPALMARTGIARPAHYDPPRGFERDAGAMRDAVGFVLAHQARFVVLAVGSPRQELLAAAIKASGHATGLGLCVGAGLEFLTGAARRAPAWMRGVGLEWLHRLAADPRRLAARYLLHDPPVLAMLLRERILGPVPGEET